MKIIFLGTGEAFDENCPNNCLLLDINGYNLLLDCGYSAPIQIWKYNPDQSFLDAIYISHLHADHYFGLPALLVRMWEEKRVKPLKIICFKGWGPMIEAVIEAGYKGFKDRFSFHIEIQEIEGSQVIEPGIRFVLAPTVHTAVNMAVRVEASEKAVCYSGDGVFTPETEEIYKDADLVIHEAYLYDEKRFGHSRITDLLDMAKRDRVKCLALTHINRNLRKRKGQLAKTVAMMTKVKVIIPEPMEFYEA